MLPRDTAGSAPWPPREAGRSRGALRYNSALAGSGGAWSLAGASGGNVTRLARSSRSRRAQELGRPPGARASRLVRDSGATRAPLSEVTHASHFSDPSPVSPASTLSESKVESSPGTTLPLPLSRREEGRPPTPRLSLFFRLLISLFIPSLDST